MAGDIKVDSPSSAGGNVLMPLAVTGMPPSRDRLVHSTAVHHEENSPKCWVYHERVHSWTGLKSKHKGYYTKSYMVQ